MEGLQPGEALPQMVLNFLVSGEGIMHRSLQICFQSETRRKMNVKLTTTKHAHTDSPSDLAAALAGSIGRAPTWNLDPARQYPRFFQIPSEKGDLTRNLGEYTGTAEVGGDSVQRDPLASSRSQLLKSDASSESCGIKKAHFAVMRLPWVHDKHREDEEENKHRALDSSLSIGEGKSSIQMPWNAQDSIDLSLA
nr:hypothetical protein CFP56_62197 [Quercus suber]